MHCGWDFGATPPAWDPKGRLRAAWRGAIDAELSALRELGVFALRWFVLADGTNAGVGPASAANESRWGGAAPTWDARARRWRFELRALPARVRRGLRGPARGARARRARAAAVARRDRLVRGRRRQRGRRGRARRFARQGSSLRRARERADARALPRRGARAAARRRRAPPTRDLRVGDCQRARVGDIRIIARPGARQNCRAGRHARIRPRGVGADSERAAFTPP